MLNNEELLIKIKKIKLLTMDVDGVLTDGRVFFDLKGGELKAFCFQDIMGISRLKKKGISVALISGEDNPIIDNFAKKMKIDSVYKHCKEKDRALLEICDHYEIELSNVAYMGDDINDIPALKIAGLAIGVPNGWDGISNFVHYYTKKSGGDGAVREICELIISNKENNEKFY